MDHAPYRDPTPPAEPAEPAEPAPPNPLPAARRRFAVRAAVGVPSVWLLCVTISGTAAAAEAGDPWGWAWFAVALVVGAVAARLAWEVISEVNP